MSVTAKTLINAKYAANSNTIEYTVPASTRTIIDKFTATNGDSSSRTVTVYLVPSSDSTADSNRIVKEKSINAGVTSDLTELQNQILSAGDKIVVAASVASTIVVRASGREVT